MNWKSKPIYSIEELKQMLQPLKDDMEFPRPLQLEVRNGKIFLQYYSG